MVKHQLSTFVDGSDIELAPFGNTLLHNAQYQETQYIKLSAFNRGIRPRALSVLLDEKVVLYATVNGQGNNQLIVPYFPIYNITSSLPIHVRMRHDDHAWTVPVELSDTLLVDEGRLSGVNLEAYQAGAGAQPIMLFVKDTRRSHIDLDATLGTEGLIELHEQNGNVLVDVIKSGEGFMLGYLSVQTISGIYINGDLISE